MFNHVGHLTLSEDVTDAQVEGIVDGLLALPGRIPGLVAAEVVRDAGLGAGNAHLRFHMRFDSREDWEGYRMHPEHVSVVKERIAPALAGKAFVQYDDAEVRTSSI
ncbi:Dabb family protein [Nocardioides campestrisoli]|uniref:Dabb family protein n=1 Tax=Nocardioides campestrisoli TaxID=2736757 RepID=UPI0015E67EFE|nr:Dabb family protein [Nocardioides campestrisoli]